MKSDDLNLVIRELKDLLSKFADAYNHRNSFKTAKIREEEIAKDQRLIDSANAYIKQNNVLSLAFNEDVASNPMYLNAIREELRNPEHFQATLKKVIQKLESQNS